MERPAATPPRHDGAAHPSGRSAGIDARLGLVLGAASVFYAVYIWRGSVTVGGRRYFTLFGDAMVSMVFAPNLAEGRGLVWSDGLAVEGYTNPAWTAWMAVLHGAGLAGSGAALAVSVTGAIILLLLAVVAHHLARELSDAPWVGSVAAGATAFCYPLVFWTLRGMGVGLVALLVACAALLTVRIQSEPTPRRFADGSPPTASSSPTPTSSRSRAPRSASASDGASRRSRCSPCSKPPSRRVSSVRSS